VAAMNPCPCGYRSDPKHECRCSAQEVSRYRMRISGPLLDRIDLVVDVPAVPMTTLPRPVEAETSTIVRGRVIRARERQRARFDSWRLNSETDGTGVARHCQVGPAAARLLETAADRMGLSARGYDRVLRVGRTIADLASADEIGADHIGEALQFRMV
jgi:magnesium chelatase family protein